MCDNKFTWKQGDGYDRLYQGQVNGGKIQVCLAITCFSKCHSSLRERKTSKLRQKPIRPKVKNHPQRKKRYLSRSNECGNVLQLLLRNKMKFGKKLRHQDR